MSQKYAGRYVLCAKCGIRRAKRETVKLAYVGRVCRNEEACKRRAKENRGNED